MAGKRTGKALGLLVHDDRIVGRQDNGIRVVRAENVGSVIIPNHEIPAGNTLTVLHILASIIFSGEERVQMASRMAGLLGSVTGHIRKVVGKMCNSAGVNPRIMMSDSMGYLDGERTGLGTPIVTDRNDTDEILMKDLKQSFGQTVEGQLVGSGETQSLGMKPIPLLENAKKVLGPDFEEVHTRDDSDDAIGSIVLQIVLLLSKAVTNPSDQRNAYERRLNKFISEGHIKESWKLSKTTVKELTKRISSNLEMRIVMTEFLCYCREYGVSGGTICQQVSNASEYVIRAGLTSFFKTLQYAGAMQSIVSAMPTFAIDLEKLDNLVDTYKSLDNKGAFMILTSDARRGQFAPNNYPVAWSFAMGVAVAREASMQEYTWERPFLDTQAFMIGQIFAQHEPEFISSRIREEHGLDQEDINKLMRLTKEAQSMLKQGGPINQPGFGARDPGFPSPKNDFERNVEDEDQDETPNTSESENEDEDLAEVPRMMVRKSTFGRGTPGRSTTMLGGMLASKSEAEKGGKGGTTLRAARTIFNAYRAFAKTPQYNGPEVGDVMRKAGQAVNQGTKPQLPKGPKSAIISGKVIPGFDVVGTFKNDLEPAVNWAIYTLIKELVDAGKLDTGAPFPYLPSKKYVPNVSLDQDTGEGGTYREKGYMAEEQAPDDLANAIAALI